MVTERKGRSFSEAFNREISFFGEEVGTLHRDADQEREEEGFAKHGLFQGGGNNARA